MRKWMPPPAVARLCNSRRASREIVVVKSESVALSVLIVEDEWKECVLSSVVFMPRSAMARRDEEYTGRVQPR